jgi:MSHA pilin protein MshC
MCATSSDRMRQAGFTMIELIIVLVLLGIVSVFVAPKLVAAISLQDDAWRDELQGALRFAQKSAVARRRLTCVAITNTTVKITTATSNPATACTVAMTGPDGNATYATAPSGSAITTVSPAGDGFIYFQPDGRVTTDGAGSSAVDRTISLTGVASLVVLGETGHVE